MAATILVYLDQFKGEALPTSWEALGVGQLIAEKTGGSVAALAVGSGSQAIAAQAFQYGAQAAYFADHPTLTDYRPEPYTSLVVKLIKELGAQVLIFPTTVRGRELAGMSAIDLECGVVPDVTELAFEGGAIIATRPVYAGKLFAKAHSSAPVQVITTRGRAFPKPASNGAAAGQPQELSPALAESEIATRVLGYSQAEGGVSLNDANVIVSGGRGVSNNPNLAPPPGLDDKQVETWRAQEGFKLIGQLAEVLGGAVGASRAAVDAGYIPYPYQVGQTGKVVSPDLYIACGISGAIQHQAGMRSSKIIVAINKDPDSPIFKLARYGVAGDLYAILPALTEVFRERLGK